MSVPSASPSPSPSSSLPGAAVAAASRVGVPDPSVPTLSAAERAAALAVPDLTDPATGLHAVQLVVGSIVRSLHDATNARVVVVRSTPVVSTVDNYDVLGFDAAAVTRDARYTRYLGDGVVLRTHTSALVPAALRSLADDGWGTSGASPTDVLLVCPGIVYRRDSVDRWHTGTPHQLDLWWLRAEGERLGESDLSSMIGAVIEGAVPASPWTTTSTGHPYTVDGRQIDAVGPNGEPVEVGECGLAAPWVLERCGLDPATVSGLALGVGLDRLVMVRKGITDIRLLRSEDPRVRRQMGDLERYRPVSSCPTVVRDLSLAVRIGTGDEELGDRVREALGADADHVEEVRVLSRTALTDLPEAARDRLGIGLGQENVLVRLVLRRLDRALRREEANGLRDAVHAALHEGGDGAAAAEVVTRAGSG